MSLLGLSSDELLATTRAVRKRLDLSRPVEPEVIRGACTWPCRHPQEATARVGTLWW
jgi:hypothetical protein